MAADGEAGDASVKLSSKEKVAAAAMITRLTSKPDGQPLTGADLGAGPGAGSVLQRADAGEPFDAPVETSSPRSRGKAAKKAPASKSKKSGAKTRR